MFFDSFARHRLLHKTLIFILTFSMLIGPGPWGAAPALATSDGEEDGQSNEPTYEQCSTCPCEPSFGQASWDAANPYLTMKPVHLKRGSVVERVTDLSLPGPVFNWSHTRTYDSGDVTSTTGRNRFWVADSTPPRLVSTGSASVDLMVNATSKRIFTGGSSPLTSPPDYSATLTFANTVDTLDLDEDSNTTETIRVYKLTELDSGNVLIFLGFTGVNNGYAGKLIERTTRHYQAAGLTGVTYAYNSGGMVSTVTTAEPQTWSINYAYVTAGGASQTSSVSVRAGGPSATEIMRADYSYATAPTSDLGTAGDLVQVKVSQRSSVDAGSTLSIVRYTQYRYYTNGSSDGRTYQLKAVFEPDAIQRAIDNGVATDANNLLTKADSLVNAYGSRHFAYFTSPVATTNCVTPWSVSGENLNTTYGGDEFTEYNGTQQFGSVKTESFGECPSCGGGTSGLKKTYHYLSKNGGASSNPNVVVKIVVEDTEDINGTPLYRRVLGLNSTGAAIRQALLEDNPSTAGFNLQRAWCTSQRLNNDSRVIEERMPSAHTVVTNNSMLQKFLNPTGGAPAWQNDTDSVNGSAGVVHYHEYDASYGDGKRRTGTLVRKGANSAGFNPATSGSLTDAHYISATDWGDNSTNKPTWAQVATYSYPTATTTRSAGKKTTYTYAFWPSGPNSAVQQVTTTLPVIGDGSGGSVDQNGSNVATTTLQCFDTLGRLRWTKDGDGYVNYYSYHPTNGEQAFVAVDVPDSYSPPVTAHWADISSGSLNQITQPTRGGGGTALELIRTAQFDELGRVSTQTEPGGGTHVTRYFSNGTARFPYVAVTTAKLPVQVTQTNDGGVVEKTFSVKPSAFATNDPAIPTSASDYSSLTVYGYDDINGQLEYLDRYHDVGGSTLSTHFARTSFVYDTLGRRLGTLRSINGTSTSSLQAEIEVQYYDLLGRSTMTKRWQQNVDLSNVNTLSLLLVALPKPRQAMIEYDSGGVGDGHVTSSKSYYGTGSSDYIDTIPQYTFRGHVRGVLRKNGTTPFGPYQVQDVDWMGRSIASAVYTSEPTWATVLGDDDYVATVNTGGRSNLTKSYYDDLGRVYRMERFPGTEGTNHFEINNYYDRRDNLVATGDKYSAQQEYAYDGAGRQYQERTVIETPGAYSSGTYTYAAPLPNPMFASMSSGDGGVIELTHSEYETDTNRLSMSHVVELNHDDSNGFSLSSGTPTGGVRQTTWHWYDDAERTIATANHGSGDTSTNTWKSTALPSGYVAGTPLNWNDAKVYDGEVLLTRYTYNTNTGRQESVISGVKKNGSNTDTITTKAFYDDLGRRTFVAENWNNFAPPSTGIGGGTNNEQDRVTGFEYNGLGQTTTLTAYNAGTTSQVTKYLYEDTYNASLVTNTIYPDSGDTNSSGTDQVKLAYHLDGSLNTRTDQRGVVITYTYDNARRVIREGATTIPGSVYGGSSEADAVRSIGRTYDSLGRVMHVTSYDNANGTGALNEIKYHRASYGPISYAYQDHAGLVDDDGMGGNDSLRVAYGYDTTTSSQIYTNGLRKNGETLPSLRTVQNRYDNTISDRLHRPSGLGGSAPGSSYARYVNGYEYNGVGRLVQARYQGTWQGLNYEEDYETFYDGTYDGLDRFGRVRLQRWAAWYAGNNVSTTSLTSYTYDYAGNRLTRDVNGTNDYDQGYTYDGLQRLKETDQGQFSAGSIISVNFEQDQTLDQLGNWTNLTETDGTTTTLAQTRAHNAVNETGTIGASTGTNWADPVHDAAGNMTTMPQPKAPASGYIAKYDAWNRLITLDGGSGVVQQNSYDGLHRRIVRDETGGSGDRRHFYYNENWQCLEERVEVSGTIDPDPIQRYVWHLYYIDALAAVWYDSDTDGNLSELTDGYYNFLHDANFNVVGVLSGGSVVERYSYSPYGGVTVLEANFSADADNKSDIGNEFLYTGRRRDPETGLQYSRYRYYHPQLGRFVNRDPIGYFGQDNNLYNYVANRPVDRIDPSGLVYGLGNGPYSQCNACGVSGTYSRGPYQFGTGYYTLPWGVISGDTIQTQTSGTLTFVSPALDDSNYDFCMGKCVIEALGFDYENYRTYFVSGLMKMGEDAKTISAPAPFGTTASRVLIDDSFVGCSSQPDSGHFLEFILTIHHETIGHAHNLDQHDGQPGDLTMDEFENKYEKPLKDAWEKAKSDGSLAKILEKCKLHCNSKKK